NYSVSYVDGNFQITPRPITVTANDLSKVFGNLDPSLTYTVTGGVIASDQLSGAPTRTAGENVGDYAIDPHGVVGSGNYAISYVNGNFQITPRPITVTADDLSKVFGNLDPSLTYTVTGGVIASDPLSGAPTRAAGENVGNYTISANGVLASG